MQHDLKFQIPTAWKSRSLRSKILEKSKIFFFEILIKSRSFKLAWGKLSDKIFRQIARGSNNDVWILTYICSVKVHGYKANDEISDCEINDQVVVNCSQLAVEEERENNENIGTNCEQAKKNYFGTIRRKIPRIKIPILTPLLAGGLFVELGKRSEYDKFKPKFILLFISASVEVTKIFPWTKIQKLWYFLKISANINIYLLLGISWFFGI